MNGCLLNNNQLSGSIPSSFRNLKNLYFFDISYNCLSVADSAIRLWLKAHDPDWEEHQNQCNNGPTLPKVTTAPVVSVTSNTAVCGGNVTSDGGAIVTRGVCWSTGTNPTINDSKTINGMGTGSFSVLIEGLNANTTYHVRAYATNSEGTSYGADVNFTTTEPIIHLSHTSLNFGASILGEITRPQTISIVNAGSGVLNWNVSGNTPWLYFTPSSGRGDSFLTISVNPVDLTAGKYNGTITIKDPQAVNSPQTLSITLQVYDQGVSIEPFGEFTTPLDGSSVYNSIAVTGWVLDDIGVENVKIYNGDSYIGDAVFVEGARPDVETAYPSYPNNFKAGWGYMIVTALLPNGPYHITAKARDWEGNDVLLGTKTITIDNTHASKPFGAIDTPTQGGTASGKNFVNYGWALTPQPNSIPIDGSTINAVIDGVIKGHPIYNIYRSDIAQLFPGYANTDGAVGYYYLDTTKLTNGLHTIAWIVADNVGNSDGIGSRYFSILNSGPSDSSFVINNTHSLPYQESGEKLYFEIKEFERVEIKLPSAKILAGYSVVGDRLKELPVGSTLDKNKNVFYWQPGPGFIGEYHLAFIGKDDEGRNTWKTIVINIKPMY
jgi:hypothetical protein